MTQMVDALCDHSLINGAEERKEFEQSVQDTLGGYSLDRIDKETFMDVYIQQFVECKERKTRAATEDAFQKLKPGKQGLVPISKIPDGLADMGLPLTENEKATMISTCKENNMERVDFDHFLQAYFQKLRLSEEDQLTPGEQEAEEKQNEEAMASCAKAQQFIHELAMSEEDIQAAEEMGVIFDAIDSYSADDPSSVPGSTMRRGDVMRNLELSELTLGTSSAALLAMLLGGGCGIAIALNGGRSAPTTGGEPLVPIFA
eukprot:gnl/TRDRNA2_/TRDRNA2_170080_c1_seq2.p1 gnl/TRDRNA2_/TRDRNA2_170080_c1~~gnl/TRDRNA2_/TRDRNA2_170080_c1_seq2.p1  ORF type:complete len:297 (+),score=76.18 gnl/TRDRNA2_/TRDRNA2_170080_c1_seq2:116-892(+)